MDVLGILWLILLAARTEAWSKLSTHMEPKIYEDFMFDQYDYEDWKHNSEFTDQPDPSELLAKLHVPSPTVSVIHHISSSLLGITKDLMSITPRTALNVGRDTSNILKMIQTLSPSDVNMLLEDRGIRVPVIQSVKCNSSHSYRTMDGSCNNLAYPCWGKAEQPYQRWLLPQYANGIDEPRVSSKGSPLPSPREVYQVVSADFTQTIGTTFPFYSGLLMTWGQMIAHDITLSPTVTIKSWDGKELKDKKPGCCGSTSPPHPDCFPIRVNHEDNFYKQGDCMEFVRTVAYSYSQTGCAPVSLGNRREQINQLTAFIDASLVYGSRDDDLIKLREDFGRGAKLKSSSMLGHHYLLRSNDTCKSTRSRCDKRCLLAGEKRANENPALAALHTLFVREHNRIVNSLSNRGWSEEKLFQEVRKIIGAMLQHITYNEYLPLILGKDLMDVMGLAVPTTKYKYDPKINPTLYNVFVTAAFRYGHSMVDSRQKRKGKRFYGSPLLSQDFFSVDDFCDAWSDPVSFLLAGQLEQKSQKVDCLFTSEVTNHLFSKSPEGKGLDLFSLNVQRGRDHGIPSYNMWREACGLTKAKNYGDLRDVMPDYIVDRLQVVYGYDNVDDIDLYVAGVSEKPVNKGILGPTFTCIIANQFKNLKYGDRFWYENTNHPGALNQAQIAALRATTFSGLLCRNSDVDEMQRMAFVTEGIHNPKVPCSTIMKETNLNLHPWV